VSVIAIFRQLTQLVDETKRSYSNIQPESPCF
jgi:hypothetical protein